MKLITLESDAVKPSLWMAQTVVYQFRLSDFALTFTMP